MQTPIKMIPPRTGAATGTIAAMPLRASLAIVVIAVVIAVTTELAPSIINPFQIKEKIL